MKMLFTTLRRRRAVAFLVFIVLAIFSVVVSAAEGPAPEVVSFSIAKEKQARALAQKLDLKVSADLWAYFKTAQTKKAPAVTNAFERLKRKREQADLSLINPVWQTALEVELAVDAFAGLDNSYSLAFGNGVIKSIPPGSIYFGGTDPGRGLVTALSKSHADGIPFFTVSQNPLADMTYLDYLREMYGNKIHTPSADDAQKAFQEYLIDAQKRREHDQKFPKEARQIKPGEDVKIADGRVQVSGQTAVMEINGRIAKIMFEANPGRDFYIEESFALDWMYPHLSPHEFIFKISREPLAELSAEILKRDREFWARIQNETIGDWLTPETSIQDLCIFTRKVF